MDDQKQPATSENNQNDTPLDTDRATSPVVSDDSQAHEIVVTTDDKPSVDTTPPTAVSEVDAAQRGTPQATVSPAPNHGAKGLLLALTLFVVIGGLAAIGYMVTRPQKTAQQVATVTKKDIPLLQVASFSPLPHTYYPNVQDDTTQTDINLQIFEGLTKFEDSTSLKPGLADSWTNPDSSTWLFKLHPGVKFHTGKTLTATDVKVSLEAIEPSDYGKTYASTIKSVEVVDPLTVKITTQGPDPVLANELAQLFIYDSTSAKPNDPINGTGPYTLVSDTPGKIKLAAFDQYHGGHVYGREVDYLGYETETDIPAASLANKELNVISIVHNSALVSKLTAAGYTITKVPSYQVGQLAFNTSKTGSPFANVKVRKAVAGSIDRAAIIKASSNTSAVITSQIIPQGIPGYNPAVKATTLSVTAAKSALADAGYPNGFSFKLTYYPLAQSVAVEIQKELATIGVTVNLDPQADQHQLFKIAVGGGTDMYYNIVNSSYVDGSDILSNFIDSANYTNTTLDSLNAEAAKELNPAKRLEILQKMAKLVADDQADIPLFQRQTTELATAPNIVITHDTASSAVGTYFWRTYQK